MTILSLIADLVGCHMVDVDSGADCRWSIQRRLFIDPVVRRLNIDGGPSNQRQRTVDYVALRQTIDADTVGYEVDLKSTINVDGRW